MMSSVGKKINYMWDSEHLVSVCMRAIRLQFVTLPEDDDDDSNRGKGCALPVPSKCTCVV